MNLKFLILAVFAIDLLIGLLFIFGPAKLIELQRKFYEQINWKIEPISMPREIRTTRIMGITIIISIFIAAFLLIKSPCIY